MIYAMDEATLLLRPLTLSTTKKTNRIVSVWKVRYDSDTWSKLQLDVGRMIENGIYVEGKSTRALEEMTDFWSAV
jgi:hypothetical protein